MGRSFVVEGARHGRHWSSITSERTSQQLVPQARRLCPGVAIGDCRSFLSRVSSEKTEVEGSSSSGAEEEKSRSPSFEFFEYLSVDIVGEGSVGLVVLNRPKALNALSKGLLEELRDVLRTFQGMPEVL